MTRLLQFGTRTLPNGTLSYDYFNLKPTACRRGWAISRPTIPRVTFKLRKDVAFHDGAPMTAKE